MHSSEQLRQLAARKAELRAEAEQIRRGFRENAALIDSASNRIETGLKWLRLFRSLHAREEPAVQTAKR